MTGTTTYLSVLTCNINGLISPHQKEPFDKMDYKRKIQQFVAYKRPISLTEMSIGLG
jgi:hypothetical protein